MPSETEIVEAPWGKEIGPIELYGCRVRSRKPGRAPLIVHYLAAGNRQTDTFYLIFFESPEASWTQAWALGERMLEFFALDDEY